MHVTIAILFNHALLFLGFWLRNKLNSRFYSMPSQRFSSLRNDGNGVRFREKNRKHFWGGEGGGGSGLPYEITPEERGRHSLSIDDEGYVNSVQPPLSEIPGSAPENYSPTSFLGNHLKCFEISPTCTCVSVLRPVQTGNVWRPNMLMLK